METIIKIEENAALITVEQIENSIISSKRVSIDSLFECIKHSVQTDGVYSGLLSTNCLSFSEKSGIRSVTLLHPELYADIQYRDTKYPDFPIPRLVFGFNISEEGRITGCKLGVIADEKPTPKTPMFIYPFSNVNGFHLCTGNNVFPKYQNLYSLASLPYFILSIPDNDDGYSINNSRLGMEHRELLNHLKDKTADYYYQNVLIPNGRTLKDFIN